MVHNKMLKQNRIFTCLSKISTLTQYTYIVI